MMRQLSTFIILIALALLAACGGDDPPPADIHPLAIKPLPSNPLAKPVDTTKQDRTTQLLVAFAKKRYPSGLDFSSMEVNDHEAADKRMAPNVKFDYEVTPKFEIIVQVAAVKAFNVADAGSQGFMPGISARRFALYDNNRMTEEEPLRIPPRRHRTH